MNYILRTLRRGHNLIQGLRLRVRLQSSAQLSLPGNWETAKMVCSCLLQEACTWLGALGFYGHDNIACNGLKRWREKDASIIPVDSFIYASVKILCIRGQSVLRWLSELMPQAAIDPDTLGTQMAHDRTGSEWQYIDRITLGGRNLAKAIGSGPKFSMIAIRRRYTIQHSFIVVQCNSRL